jgi:hypothetical protein
MIRLPEVDESSLVGDNNMAALTTFNITHWRGGVRGAELSTDRHFCQHKDCPVRCANEYLVSMTCYATAEMSIWSWVREWFQFEVEEQCLTRVTEDLESGVSGQDK